MWRRYEGKDSSTSAVPYNVCLAKTFLRPDGLVGPGRTVESHCIIVGNVAKSLLARYPVELREKLFPPGAALAAATHDIGKVSPTFYEKIRRACAPDLQNLAPLSNINPSLESSWGGHAGVSQLTAHAMQSPSYVPEILGQHHGFAPAVTGRRAMDETFGGPGWQAERVRLVMVLMESLGETWPEVSSIAQARILAGLTSVADWIGSGQYFEDPENDWADSIGKALDAAGFVPPTYNTGLSFETVFGFDARAVQTALIEQVTGSGLYLLEAPMGQGKTEAALFAAYQLLCTKQATGIYFALPTQLTSNKIFERFNSFLEQVLAKDCGHRSLLLHANAWLQDTEMGEEGRPGGAWFNQAKRGLLAPFAVGTIDQALMAAMNVKHGFVRAFGLAGKVVILDEVHTYDAYTGTILDALIKLLRELHCTVIILSATLNHERRERLVGLPLHSTNYPLITASPGSATVREISTPSGTSNKIGIRIPVDERLAVEEALRRSEQGQQVLWIENTVLAAQSRYLDIAARAREMGVACGLLHSRYTVDDRQRIESEWINRFGKPGWRLREKQGRILVGTQVLEQSLDIDADFMVSRFAPTDMLLQRLGRLWRHEDTPRCPHAKREAWLLAPGIGEAIEHPERAFGESAFVYSPYVLCRSLEVWNAKVGLTLPDEIRELIESTYVTRRESGQMNRWLYELDHGTRWRSGREALQGLARVTLAEAGNTQPESKAQTRHNDTENFDVLLLRLMRLVPDEQLTVLTLQSGVQLKLPWKRHRLDKAEWRQLTTRLMRQVVAVRVQDAPPAVPRKELERFGLHHCFYLGSPDWLDDESLLRVALVDGEDRLKSITGSQGHLRNILEYRDDLGYRVIK